MQSVSIYHNDDWRLRRKLIGHVDVEAESRRILPSRCHLRQLCCVRRDETGKKNRKDAQSMHLRSFTGIPWATPKDKSQCEENDSQRRDI